MLLFIRSDFSLNDLYYYINPYEMNNNVHEIHTHTHIAEDAGSAVPLWFISMTLSFLLSLHFTQTGIAWPHRICLCRNKETQLKNCGEFQLKLRSPSLFLFQPLMLLYLFIKFSANAGNCFIYLVLFCVVSSFINSKVLNIMGKKSNLNRVWIPQLNGKQ